MATQQTYVKLAQSLHPRLLRLFARFPPPALQPQQTLPTGPSATTALKTYSIEPSENLDEGLNTSETSISQYSNPFLPTKHHITGVRNDPIYSLRRQAELVKLAREHSVEELLPPTIKGTEARIRKRDEHGLRVRGTGIGQRVKGKWWERTLKGRLERRRQAMLEMPKLIQTWKQLGNGRGWKNYPK